MLKKIIIHHWNKFKKKLNLNNNHELLYIENYTYREAPFPRPYSNVSLGEVFSWFFKANNYLPENPHVNEIAKRCRENIDYTGNRPKRIKWSSERETGHTIYSLVRLIKPQNVIEVGIFNGATSISIAQGLKDNNQDSLLHCIEIDDHSINLTQ